MKLWQKENTVTSEKIERFTVGRDREMDIHLAEFDVLGNIAHATMLETMSLPGVGDLAVDLLPHFEQLAAKSDDVFGSIEQEMANLLGRPSGKPS